MLGILCGLESEAAIARKIPNALVACSAAQPQQARWAARDLVKRGARRLLSFGLAGGLEPGLPAGTLVIATAIQSKDDHWHCDSDWGAQLTRQIPAAHCGAVWGAETIVVTVRDKRILYERSRCLVADMESHCVAQIATEAKLPFAVMRAVVDTSDMALPSAAMVPLQKNGRVDLSKVLVSLLCRPTQLPALIQLGVNTRIAMQKLRDVAMLLDTPYEAVKSQTFTKEA